MKSSIIYGLIVIAGLWICLSRRADRPGKDHFDEGCCLKPCQNGLFKAGFPISAISKISVFLQQFPMMPEKDPPIIVICLIILIFYWPGSSKWSPGLFGRVWI